jgi:hypothetical protein
MVSPCCAILLVAALAAPRLPSTTVLLASITQVPVRFGRAACADAAEIVTLYITAAVVIERVIRRIMPPGP